MKALQAAKVLKNVKDAQQNLLSIYEKIERLKRKTAIPEMWEARR